MVNDSNQLEGRQLSRHPLADQVEEIGVYSPAATVLAVQAPTSGFLRTMEGEVTFQPNDWIVTDNPPRKAWVVRDQVFHRHYGQVLITVPGGSAGIPLAAEPPAEPPAEAKTKRSGGKVADTGSLALGAEYQLPNEGA